MYNKIVQNLMKRTTWCRGSKNIFWIEAAAFNGAGTVISLVKARQTIFQPSNVADLHSSQSVQGSQLLSSPLCLFVVWRYNFQFCHCLRQYQKQNWRQSCLMKKKIRKIHARIGFYYRYSNPEHYYVGWNKNRRKIL